MLSILSTVIIPQTIDINTSNRLPSKNIRGNNIATKTNHNILTKNKATKKRSSHTITNISRIPIYIYKHYIQIILLLPIHFFQLRTIYNHNHFPITILYMHQSYPLYLLLPILPKTTILKNLRSKKTQKFLIIIILLGMFQV